MNYRSKLTTSAAAALLLFAFPGCGEEDNDDDTTAGTSADGSATTDDSTTGTMETTADGTGDGDGDASSGDGDSSTGDGDSSTGDGDGDACGMDPGWGTVAANQPVKHISAVNHDGTAYNTCELAGTPWLIDVSTVWCGPCNDASSYLAGINQNDPFSGMGPQIKDMIATQKIIWLTFLTETASGGATTQADGAIWDGQYPNPNIPVLTEGDTGGVNAGLGVGCFPSAYVVQPDQTFLAVEDCTTWNQLQAMIQAYG